jgi:hypothetical protein
VRRYGNAKDKLYRFADPINGPFEERDAKYGKLFGGEVTTVRHVSVLREAADSPVLRVFYTRVGDAPERVVEGVLDMSKDWSRWKVVDARDVIEPVESWEGADEQVEKSKNGSVKARVNQLRDPFVLCVPGGESGAGAGEHFLYYAAGGESAIGVTRLPDSSPCVPLPQPP